MNHSDIVFIAVVGIIYGIFVLISGVMAYFKSKNEHNSTLDRFNLIQTILGVLLILVGVLLFPLEKYYVVLFIIYLLVVAASVAFLVVTVKKLSKKN